MEKELTQDELAARWRMNPGTLAVWRSLGRGPVYNKRGGKVTYSIEDIENYENECKIYPQKEGKDDAN